MIVLTEDEPLIRMLMAEALVEAGFEVLEAGHAEDALALLGAQARDVHVLFTDIHMPGPMDGLELARHASTHWPWIALLVTSGRATPTSGELPTGSRFLPKPYTPEQALSHIRELAAAG